MSKVKYLKKAFVFTLAEDSKVDELKLSQELESKFMQLCKVNTKFRPDDLLSNVAEKAKVTVKRDINDIIVEISIRHKSSLSFVPESINELVKLNIPESQPKTQSKINMKSEDDDLESLATSAVSEHIAQNTRPSSNMLELLRKTVGNPIKLDNPNIEDEIEKPNENKYENQNNDESDGYASDNESVISKYDEEFKLFKMIEKNFNVVNRYVFIKE